MFPPRNTAAVALPDEKKTYRGLPEGTVVVRQDRSQPQLHPEEAQKEVLHDREPVGVVVPAGVPAATAVACRGGETAPS